MAQYPPAAGHADTLIPGLSRLGDWSSWAQLHRHQADRLRKVREYAARSPFYRARHPAGQWPQHPAELPMLPQTTKAQLRDAYPFGLLAVPRARLATYHESSGTMGAPTSSYFTEGDWHEVIDRFARSAVGFGPEDTVLVKTPYAMLTTAHQAHQGARLLGATVVAADNRSLVMPYSRVVRLLADLAVTVAWCLPSECLLWAAAARAGGYDPRTDFPRLRAFLVAGEPLTEARRARISAVWGGVPVLQDYGSTETGSLAGECPRGRFHLWADRFLPEVLDPRTGRSGREGTGQLVITMLYREAMPLVRYNIEDLVEVSFVDCPCGWVLPTVRVRGRAAGGLALGSAGVTQADLEDLVFRLPEEYGVFFWRARRSGTRLEVEIEASVRHREEAGAALRRAITESLGIDSEVRAMSPGTLVPEEVLTTPDQFAKPRNLFDEGEDWSKAAFYY